MSGPCFNLEFEVADDPQAGLTARIWGLCNKVNRNSWRGCEPGTIRIVAMQQLPRKAGGSIIRAKFQPVEDNSHGLYDLADFGILPNPTAENH